MLSTNDGHAVQDWSEAVQAVADYYERYLRPQLQKTLTLGHRHPHLRKIAREDLVILEAMASEAIDALDATP